MVKVDFDKAVLDIVDYLIVDGFGRQMSGKCDLKIDTAVVTSVIGNTLYIKLERGLLEEKINILQIGLHILVYGRGAVVIEVIFHLHLVIDENLAPTLRKHDFLLQSTRRAITDDSLPALTTWSLNHWTFMEVSSSLSLFFSGYHS